jgi:hypothetical protein
MCSAASRQSQARDLGKVIGRGGGVGSGFSVVTFLSGSPGGRPGHKVREFKRRIDAVLDEERAVREPPPPPISEEHAAMRERIARGMAALEEQIPEGTDLDGAIRENPDLANDAAQLGGLMREERDFLVSQGVDP